MRIISMFCFLFLFGCSVIKYDGGEYSKMVDVIYNVSDPETFCNEKSLKDNVQKLSKDLLKISIYEGGQPDNEDTIKMLVGVTDDVNRFKTLTENPVSYQYCKLKLESLTSVLNLILKAQGSKPR